ncbi:MAG: polysaccharide biosynthesis C-terminal domain-containing protein, partial [Muribaculaceae bacterium]
NEKIKPQFKLVEFQIIKDIMSLGVKFFVIQIITICLYQTNNILLAQFHNIESVSEYNIAFKYMNTLYFAYMIIVTPAWSATTEAYILKDYAWIRKLEFKLTKIWFIMLIVGAILILISSNVYTIWLNESVLQSNKLLLSLLLCLILSQAMYGNYGFIINGIGKLRAQIVITGVTAVFYIPVTIYFVKLFGLYGVAISGIIVNLINICWSRFQFKKLINADFKQNSFWTR